MTDPPILLEPGLRYAGCGKTEDGQMWIKFINIGVGRLRAVTVYVTSTATFHYNYAIADKATHTVVGYQGPHGDPAKDTSYVWGTGEYT